MFNPTFCVKFGIYDKEDYFHVILRLVLHIITHYMHTHVATKSIINNHKAPRYIISEYHAYHFALHLFDDFLRHQIYVKLFLKNILKLTLIKYIVFVKRCIHPENQFRSILIYSDHRIYDTSDCR